VNTPTPAVGRVHAEGSSTGLAAVGADEFSEPIRVGSVGLGDLKSNGG